MIPNPNNTQLPPEGAEAFNEAVMAAWQDDAADEKESAATVLVRLAMARYDFGISEAGETFAVPKKGPKVVQLLRGGKTSLRSQLSREFFKVKGKAAPQQALADALLVLQGEAEGQPESTLYQRVARHGGALWLDLGDHTGRAVKIANGRWSVEPEPPVLFRRTALTAPLPEPVPGGRLEELWQWLNVTEADRPLVAAWLVSLLYDSIPHPILGLFGEQGTGKTTAEKVLVSIIDPSPVPTRKPPKDAESWVTAASGSWVVGLDNLTTVPDWLSDSMCRAVTGEGDVRRQLYADNALVVFAFRRCLIVTGIDLGALNGDLADRMLAIELAVISEEARRDEDELWPKWREAHPRILGAVLDLAARVSELLPSIRLERRPRMADFAKILRAVDEVLGTNGLARYMEQQAKMARDALSGDPFTLAMATKITDTFVGTSKELLDLLTPDDPVLPKGWPRTPRAVTVRLRRQAPVLRKAGWIVTDDDGANEAGTIRWTITRPREAGKSDPSNPSPGGARDVGRVNGATGDDFRASLDRAPVTTGAAGRGNGATGNVFGPSQDERPARKQWCRRWLGEEGRFCGSTEGLRRYPIGWLCPEHQPQTGGGGGCHGERASDV